MIRALFELLVASLRLMRARVRALTDPCPPHDIDERYGFCVKCGERRDPSTS